MSILTDQCQAEFSVLIVDDNSKNLQVLQRMLESRGYRVLPAISGKLALRSLEKVQPDLILLDINMPGMDGYETCERIKSIKACADIPIIFVSALDTINDKIKAFLCGGVDYIVKPFQIEEVLARVNTHLSLSGMRKQLARSNQEVEAKVQGKTRELEDAISRYKNLSVREKALAKILRTPIDDLAVNSYINKILEALNQVLDKHEQNPSAAVITFNDHPNSHAFNSFTLGDKSLNQQLNCLMVCIINELGFGGFLEADTLIVLYEGFSATRIVLKDEERPLGLAAGDIKTNFLIVPIKVKNTLLSLLAISIPPDQAFREEDIDYYRQVAEVIGSSLARRSSDRKIEFLAYHDELTGLPNRRLMNDRIAHEINVSGRTGMVGALVYLDLDDFKLVNDALGHEVGDSVLKITSQRIQEVLRSTDSCARWGGDEFVIMLPMLSDERANASERAHFVSDKIRQAITRPFHIDSHEVQMSISIGITLFGKGDKLGQEYLVEADAAMYQAKKTGKNAIQFFKPEYQSRAESRLALTKGLRQAVKNNELYMVYQPQVNKNGEIVGLETLMRWESEEFGFVRPDVFIALAEESNLIVDLDLFAIRSACSQFMHWQQEGLLPKAFKRLAINICPRHFSSDQFVSNVRETLEHFNMSPEHLELEVTERLMLSNVDTTIAKLNELKNLGVSFSIDDFGTGYSSLSYLLKLPIDMLKIDRSFVSDVHLNQQAATIVSTIIGMAKNLGLETIAEGVEEKEEFDHLLRDGCDYYQGYKFYKPIKASELRSIFSDINSLRGN
ncbi:EAL domain-containing protein [uncultured Pseudoteredinibacter sp.]|uniref:EAL domain-containing protein n=1 Tax=uncultured Pseudoteredinibacter sp. TaxID=1641701 RepID=UPI0026133D59|nr:EAL domain-containing protein [uncultured Pseudoteredinibacter sp.]